MTRQRTTPPPPPPPRPPRPAPHPVDPRRPRVLVAVGLVLGTSLILTPLATRVWTTAMVPAADRWHYGEALVPALALAGCALYLAVSVLLMRRRTTPTARSERK